MPPCAPLPFSLAVVVGVSCFFFVCCCAVVEGAPCALQFEAIELI